MYGEVNDLPITLNTPMKPISPYGVSKMSSYFMINTYRDSYNLFAVNGVLFNHESFLRTDTFFIKKIIKSAIEIREKKIKNIRLGNLNVRRDFGFAPKYVEAMWKMLQLNLPQDFIICSGESLRLKDIVYYVFDKLNINKNLIVEDNSLYRVNEIEDIYGDNSKAKDILNWDYNLTFFDVLDILIEEESKFIET